MAETHGCKLRDRNDIYMSKIFDLLLILDIQTVLTVLTIQFVCFDLQVTVNACAYFPYCNYNSITCIVLYSTLNPTYWRCWKVKFNRHIKTNKEYVPFMLFSKHRWRDTTYNNSTNTKQTKTDKTKALNAIHIILEWQKVFQMD